jgi:hypothetical protein
LTAADAEEVFAWLPYPRPADDEDGVVRHLLERHAAC